MLEFLKQATLSIGTFNELENKFIFVLQKINLCDPKIVCKRGRDFAKLYNNTSSLQKWLHDYIKLVKAIHLLPKYLTALGLHCKCSDCNLHRYFI